MIRRLLSRIVIAVLLAAWGYSAWQTQQLRLQVRTLQTENRGLRLKNGPAVHSQRESAANPSWLALASDHIKRAGDALSHADPARAEREITAGAEAMQRAGHAPIEQTETAIVRAHQQVKQLDVRLEVLQAQMDALSAKTGPQINHLRAQADDIKAQAQSLWQAQHHEAAMPKVSR